MMAQSSLPFESRAYQATVLWLASGQRGSASPSNARISNHSQVSEGASTANQPSGEWKVRSFRYWAGRGAMPVGVAAMPRSAINPASAGRERDRARNLADASEPGVFFSRERN